MRMTSFETFFKYYWPRLVRYLMSQASDTSLAEDVAADAMTAVLDKWDELLFHERPDSWLFKVATRRLRRFEAQARTYRWLGEDRIRFDFDDDLWRDLHPRAYLWAVEDEAVTNSTARAAIDALRQLPRRQRETLTLTMRGYSPAEAARLLGIEANAVRVHLHHARRKVRARLDVGGQEAAAATARPGRPAECSLVLSRSSAPGRGGPKLAAPGWRLEA